jgi:(4S)-4-hydroxy-5-phosphonooxypentane-2,3-dione isomerase
LGRTQGNDERHESSGKAEAALLVESKIACSGALRHLFAKIGAQNDMFIVHVHVHVKPESVEAFRHATTENAQHSLEEPGIARFDVVQHREDTNRFVLVEVYRDEAAAGAHKETPHYKKWRDAVADMMAEPRSSVKFTNVFPGTTGW